MSHKPLQPLPTVRRPSASIQICGAPLSRAFGSVREDVVSLCTRLAAGVIPAAKRVRHQAKDTARVDSLEDLLAGLRLFGETLSTLESLAERLEYNHYESGDAAFGTFGIPAIASYKNVLADAAFEVDYPPPPGACDPTTLVMDNLEDYRSQMEHVIQFSGSLDELYVGLSMQSGLEPAVDTSEGDPSHIADIERASSWLNLLNSPAYDREPDEFYLERCHVRTRRAECPAYTTAATEWPKFAEQYWDYLQPQILRLFAVPRSLQFVQWALEYARVARSDQLGLQAASADEFLNLTDALCDGTASPLHLAAILGLPKLCQSLCAITVPDTVKQGPFGNPLFCALAGPSALVNGARPASWSALLSADVHSPGRIATVRSLMLAGRADWGFRFQFKDGDEASFAGLFFWNALLSNEYRVFKAGVTPHLARVDKAFNDLLLDIFELAPPGSEVAIARGCTAAYDVALAIRNPENCHRRIKILEDPEDATRIEETIQDLMTSRNLQFVFDDPNVQHLRSDRFDYEVRSTILEHDLFRLKRLALDSRFRTTAPATMTHNGTVAHTAVSEDNIEVVRFLKETGVDFTATDSEGRTPMMVVESTEMLNVMIFDFGLSSTDTNDTGRNIWHLAAASNDVSILKWLCEKDPSRGENMSAKTAAGLTPLGEALHLVRELRKDCKGLTPATPRAAKLLLKQGAPLDYPTGSTPLCHVAAEWGDLDLVERLVDAGVEFRDLDEAGGSALHSLNASASPQLVRRMQELCSGLPIYNDDGSTPAETILSKTTVIRALGGGYEPSAHPSCAMSLSDKAYSQLLTPEILEYHDYRDRDMWARFCDKIFHAVLDPPYQDPDCLEFYFKSVVTAVKCLVRHGATKNYETETGEPAIAALWSSGGSDSHQAFDNVPIYFPLIRYILEHSDPEVLQDFYESESATAIMMGALEGGDTKLIALLAPHLGSPCSLLDEDEYGYCSFFEAALFYDDSKLERVKILFPHVTPEELLSRQNDIFDLVIAAGVRCRHQKLEFLLQNGLPPDPQPNASLLGLRRERLPALIMAIEAFDRKSLQLLLQYGADATCGQCGCCAIISCIEESQQDYLADIIASAKEDFNWHFLHSEFEDCGTSGTSSTNEPKDTVFSGLWSVLQYAALFGNADALELLLRDTPLRKEVNNGTRHNSESPAFVAIKSNSITCLKVLVKYGADLTAKGEQGNTALHIAVVGQQTDILPYLLTLGLEDVPNDDGMTAHEMAIADQNPDILRAFERNDSRLPDSDERKHKAAS